MFISVSRHVPGWADIHFTNISRAPTMCHSVLGPGETAVDKTETPAFVGGQAISEMNRQIACILEGGEIKQGGSPGGPGGQGLGESCGKGSPEQRLGGLRE